MLGYYTCGACGCKVREDNWDKHIKTKKHIRYQKSSGYAEEIFNSGLMTKIPLLLSFIPKVKMTTSFHGRSS